MYVLEITTYRSSASRRPMFDTLVRESVVPLLGSFGVHVVCFGPSIADGTHYYLMRSYASATLRQVQLDAVDGSDEWQQMVGPGLRDLIDAHHSVVIDLEAALVSQPLTPSAPGVIWAISSLLGTGSTETHIAPPRSPTF